MSDTALIRHLVGKLSLDTAAFTAGSKRAQVEAAALKKRLEVFDDASVGVKKLSAEIKQLQLHMKAVAGGFGSGMFGANYQAELQARVSGMKKERAELQEIVKLENLRRMGAAQWSRQRAADVASAIAMGAAQQSSSSALSPDANVVQGAGLLGVLRDVKQFSTIVKGGGVLLGITQLTNTLRGLKQEIKEIGDNGDQFEKSIAVMRKIPGVGLITEVAEMVDPFGDFSERAERQRKAAGRQELSDLGVKNRFDLENREIAIAREREIMSLGDDVEKEVKRIEFEMEDRIKAIKELRGLEEEVRLRAIAVEEAYAESKISEVYERRDIEANERIAENARALKKHNEQIIEALDSLDDTRIALESELMNPKKKKENLKTSTLADLEEMDMMRADDLFKATRTKAERFKEMFDELKYLRGKGSIDDDVFARALAKEVGGGVSAMLPDLGVRGSQAAESMISRAGLGDTKKTQEQILKEIMKLVQSTNDGNALFRKLAEKFGSGADLN